MVADPQRDAQMQALYQRLLAHQPPSQRVSLVHNDLKLDDCMFDPADPDRVIAFFDWDMTTLGDPLIDLGTLLNYWPDLKDAPDQLWGHDGMQFMGLPTRQEVIKRYGDKTGLDVSRAGWFEAFGYGKPRLYCSRCTTAGRLETLQMNAWRRRTKAYPGCWPALMRRWRASVLPASC